MGVPQAGMKMGGGGMKGMAGLGMDVSHFVRRRCCRYDH